LQNRPLQEVYSIVFMDALFLKMRTEGHVRNVAVYAIVGIDLEGTKEVLGLWVSETESSKYWLTVLNELILLYKPGRLASGNALESQALNNFLKIHSSIPYLHKSLQDVSIFIRQ